MPKPQTKNWKQKNFSLDVRAIEKLEELSKFEGMSESEFIEFLIFNWDAGVNPQAKLAMLMNERKGLSGQMSLIENKIKETSDAMIMFNDWSKQKSIKRKDALQVLEKKIRDEEFEEAERVAKVWQKMTGISALDLLIEAKKNVEVKGT